MRVPTFIGHAEAVNLEKPAAGETKGAVSETPAPPAPPTPAPPAAETPEQRAERRGVLRSSSRSAGARCW